ncbi:6-phosphogluconate dehydrogenase C-terminal domain-like protein [Hypoxylon sp. FL0543]|nr:6-phosphogluconate dehydrogenase C-terminal domain-like protein [Hypoxylon sp. FL0543]
MAAPLAKIGIISLGDMGSGIAKLLVANGFSVATNVKGRSNDTVERAKSAQVELLTSDEDLAQSCSVVLSVVPPRDAVATAQRILDAVTGPVRRSEDNPLYFADLNAVAPSSVKSIASLFNSSRAGASVRFVDGSILGGPPSPKADSSTSNGNEWSLPSIPTSGPHSLADIPGYGPKLFATLNMRHISPEVGAASGLKMCFASLSKGLTALAVQSFATAHRLGVLHDLQDELRALMPHHYRLTERGVVGMAPKAYRWVAEMEEIARTLSEEGGFAPDSFVGAAKVYRTVADDTVLGREKVGKRRRGTTVEDVAAAMAEGMQSKRKKND